MTSSAADESTDATPTGTTGTTDRLRRLDLDLVRYVHKGIRSALFAVTTAAGRLDPADDIGLEVLAAEIRDVARLLADHARADDEHIQPALTTDGVGRAIADGRDRLESSVERIVDSVTLARSVAGDERRRSIHELYLELAAFTGAYLAQQDHEERVVAPVLSVRLGADGVADLFHRIVTDMRPDELTRCMVATLPALDVDDRRELLDGLRSAMTADAFDAVWSLASSLLSDEDLAPLAARLRR
jgi:hypothetical protein